MIAIRALLRRTDRAVLAAIGCNVVLLVAGAMYDANFLSRKWGFSMPPLNLRGVVSASIGMAEYRPDPQVHRSIEEDRNDVLRRADGAMYEAKSLGGNRVIVAGTTDNGAKVRHPVEGGF